MAKLGLSYEMSNKGMVYECTNAPGAFKSFLELINN